MSILLDNLNTGNSVFGQLDTAEQCCMRVSQTMQSRWNSGTDRMTKRDIERARNYIRNITRSCKTMQDVLKLYDTIAQQHEQRNNVAEEKEKSK